MEAGEGDRGVAVPQLSPAEVGGEGAPSRIKKRKRWTAEEDAVLAEYVRVHGEENWNTVAKITGLARTGQCCRARWLNYLRTGLKKGRASFSTDEELQLARLHAALGNKWSTIAAEMTGRSEYECMKYWKAYVKRCRHAGVSVYPPEVQAAGGGGGGSDLHQPQHKRRKGQTSQLPPPPPSHFPAVASDQMPQPHAAFYPAPATVMENMSLHNGQLMASHLPLSSNRNIDQRSLQLQPPFETAWGFDFLNFQDLTSRTSVNVYHPEEQAAAGEPDLHQQQQDTRYEDHTFPLQPPTPSMLPPEYLNYPAVAYEIPQAHAAFYPSQSPVAINSAPLPVTENMSLHNGQFMASLLQVPSNPNIDQSSLQLQPPFETASGFDFENFQDLTSGTSVNVYYPEEQAAAGEPDLHQQQQDKRHEDHTSPLPSPLPSMIPLEYLNYPAVASQIPQPHAAVDPAPVTVTSAPLPATEMIPLHNGQFLASPSMLPQEYLNYPLVVSQMPQALVSVYPSPVTAPPAPIPVTAAMPLHNDQSSASVRPLPSDPNADQMSLQFQTPAPPFSGFSFEDLLGAYRRVESSDRPSPASVVET